MDSAWLATRTGLPQNVVRVAGFGLLAIALVAFIAAGLGLVGIPLFKLVWQAAAITGSVASLLLLGFYWHPWLVLGVVIDAGAILGIALHWPAKIF